MEIAKLKIKIGLAIFFCLVASSAQAIDLTSTSFIVRDPIIGTLGEEFGSSASFILISAGHTSLSDIGGTSTSFAIRYGFLYYSDRGNNITFDIDTAAGGGNGESS